MVSLDRVFVNLMSPGQDVHIFLQIVALKITKKILSHSHYFFYLYDAIVKYKIDADLYLTV